MKTRTVVRGLWIALAAATIAAPQISADHQNAVDCDVELFGSAVLEDGIFEVQSEDLDGGGVAIIPTDDLFFEDLSQLRTDYNLTNDGAGGGSPRFQIALDDDGDGDGDGNVFVYIGTPPNFTDPPAGWQDTGNLIGNTGDRFDLTQFGGDFFATHAEALALVGDLPIVEVALVVDGGWFQADGEQTVLFDEIIVNDCLIEDEDEDGVPSPIDECPDSDLRPFVDVNGAQTGQTTVPNVVNDEGCSIQDEVNEAADNAGNHGQFVSAIAHIANDFRKAGLITSAQSTQLKQAAAHSNFGNGGGDDDDDDDDEDDDEDDDGKGKGKGKGKGNKGGNGNGKGKGKK